MQILDYNGLQFLSNNIQNLSNPNMIINPDFSINQRNKNEYNITNYTRTYTIDRWTVKGKSTLKVLDNSINLIKTSEAGEAYTAITQVIENCSKIEGKELTLSVQYIDNNEKKIAILNIDKDWDFKQETYEIKRIWILEYLILAIYARPDKMLEVDFHIAKTAPLNFNCIFSYVKLELGKVATIFTPPDLTIEKFKCMRYYQKIGIEPKTNLISSMILTPICFYIYGDNNIKNFLDFYCNLNVEMRTIPIGKLYGISNDDTGYSIANKMGASPDKTRNWEYNIVITDTKFIMIHVTAENGNLVASDFDTKVLIFYSNSGIELDAEIYEYKNIN